MKIGFSLGWAVAAGISALLATGGMSIAEDSDLQAAVERYHRAIEARDLSKMASLWEHNDQIVLVNPVSTAVAVG